MRESTMQRECVKWFGYRFPKAFMFAPMNEGVRGKVKGKGGMFSPEGTKAKAMGKRAGVADLMILAPRQGYHGLFVELKTPKGRQTREQKAFEAAVTAEGYRYLVIRSVDEFMIETEKYLLGESVPV